jgi:prepilin-type N-terminal cleavage/methylation domain-containing protein
MKRKNKKGLTLVEILAVIVIMGILLTIGIVGYKQIFSKSELSMGINQASVVRDEVAKYIADNNGQLPVLDKTIDYIAKPSIIDLSKVATNLNGKVKGNFYVFGPAKDVTYDYPADYIKTVYDNYTGDKTKLLIPGGSYIDTDKLFNERLLENPTFTAYMLENDGNVLQVATDKEITLKSNSANGSKKPTTPVIVPNHAGPYYDDETITFTASSYSAKGDVTYQWTGVSSNNKYSSTNGIHLTVVAIDKDGNSSDQGKFDATVFSASSKKQLAKPTIVVNPDKPQYSSDEIIDVSATSPDSGVTFAWIGTTTSKTYPRGQNVVSVYAVGTDGNGNKIISDKASKTLNVTNGKPKVNGVTMNPSPAYVFETVKFSVDATDPDGDLLSYEFGGDVNDTGRYGIGNYSGKVRAKDSMGAYSDWFTFPFQITNRLPSVPGFIKMTPNENSDIRSYTKIIFEAGGATDPDEESKNLTFEWNNKLDYFTVGQQTVKVRTVDSNGGKSDWISVSFTVNDTPPTKPAWITGTPASTPIYADVPITWAVGGATDLDGQAPSPDGDYVTYEWNRKQTTYTKGSYVVQARAVDKHGLKSDWLDYNLTVVNKPPTIPVISMVPGPATDIRANTNITWGATSTDVDNDALTYEWTNKQSTYTKGLKTVQVRAKDQDGAYSNWQSISFTVNNTRPTNPTITMNPSPSATNYTTTPISFGCSGATDIDVSDTIRYEYSNARTYYARGWNTVYCRAVDTDGAISDWMPISFYITNSNPNLPSISMSPTSYNIWANTPVTFYSTGTDADGDTLTYNWTGKQQYYSKGWHNTSVYTTDGNGGTSPTATISFFVNNTAPQGASIYAQLSNGARDYHTFTRSNGYDPVDNDPLTYEYQVDWGAWSTNVPNQYYSNTTHTVGLRVKDNSGDVSGVNTVTFYWQADYYVTVTDHDAYYQQTSSAWNETVTDSSAWTETVIDYIEYRCSGHDLNTPPVYFDHSGSCDYSFNHEYTVTHSHQVYHSAVTHTVYHPAQYQYIPATTHQELRSGYWHF